MRSEDDLRAAFTAKAGEAPAAEQVLRAVRQAESRPPQRRRWLAPAVAVAAAAAVGVPLGLAVSHSSNNTSKKADMQARVPSVGGAPSAASGNGKGAPAPGVGAPGAGSGQSQQGAAGLAVCRPSDVTVTLRRNGAAARLSVTASDTPCRLARVPSIQWPSGSTTYRTSDEPASGKPTFTLGLLRAGTTATATVQWSGCDVPGGRVAYVDWGRGPVPVSVSAPTPATSCSKSPGPISSVLQVGPLSGLS